jgi:hypothetical protein
VCDKNSGRIGGRFQERKKLRNPVSGNYFAEKDFTIGRTVQLGGFKFMLMSTDEYTQKYMEDNGDNFPEASFNVIMRKIKAPAANFPSLQEYCVDLLARLDKNGDHFVDYREFADGLRAMNIMVT